MQFWTDGIYNELYSDDYLATAGEVTFAPGETTKTFTVAVLGDTFPEADDTEDIEPFEDLEELDDEGRPSEPGGPEGPEAPR